MSWRRSRSRALPKKHKSYIALVIKVLLLGLLFGLLAFIFKSYQAWKHRLWINGARITVVVASSDPTIYSYNPENATIASVVIPKNTQVSASGNYGTWLAGSLWGLGVQEKKGGQLLSRSVQKTLGVPVDAWTGPGGEALFADHKLGVLAAVFQVIQMQGVETNLTFFDKVNIILASGTVGRLSRTKIDLEKKDVIVKTNLSDGVQGYVVIPESTNLALDPLRDDKVFAQAKTLKIINSSQTSGLATQVARVSNILGLRVLSTDTTDKKVLGACVVRGKQSDLATIAAKRLIQTYNCDSEVGEPSGLANFEMILGKKFALEF